MTRPANPELPGKILDAAEKIVATLGHDALHMRRLADAAGITPTTLYYYFDSRDHILAQIKLRAAKRLNGKLQRLDLSDPAGALREIARAHVAFAEEHPRLYRLFMERLSSSVGLADDEQRTLHFSYYAAQRALETLRPLAPAGKADIAVADPRRKAMEKWVLLHGFVSLFASGALETVVGTDREELKKTFFDIFADPAGGVPSPRGGKPHG